MGLGGFSTEEQKYDDDNNHHKEEFAHNLTPFLGLGLKPPVVLVVSNVLYHVALTMYSVFYSIFSGTTFKCKGQNYFGTF